MPLNLMSDSEIKLANNEKVSNKSKMPLAEFDLVIDHMKNLLSKYDYSYMMQNMLWTGLNGLANKIAFWEITSTPTVSSGENAERENMIAESVNEAVAVACSAVDENALLLKQEKVEALFDKQIPEPEKGAFLVEAINKADFEQHEDVVVSPENAREIYKALSAKDKKIVDKHQDAIFKEAYATYEKQGDLFSTYVNNIYKEQITDAVPAQITEEQLFYIADNFLNSLAQLTEWKKADLNDADTKYKRSQIQQSIDNLKILRKQVKNIVTRNNTVLDDVTIDDSIDHAIVA